MLTNSYPFVIFAISENVCCLGEIEYEEILLILKLANLSPPSARLRSWPHGGGGFIVGIRRTLDGPRSIWFAERTTLRVWSLRRVDQILDLLMPGGRASSESRHFLVLFCGGPAKKVPPSAQDMEGLLKRSFNPALLSLELSPNSSSSLHPYSLLPHSTNTQY